MRQAHIHYLIGPDDDEQFTEHEADVLWLGHNEKGERVILVENSSQYPDIIHSVSPIAITGYEMEESSQ